MFAIGFVMWLIGHIWRERVCRRWHLADWKVWSINILNYGGIALMAISAFLVLWVWMP